MSFSNYKTIGEVLKEFVITYNFDKPYFVVIEAKKDDFEQGWSQCLVEMITAQKLNSESEVIIFGIVSNGKNWECGKLAKNKFTRNQKIYSIQQLHELFAAINYIYQQAKLQLQKLVTA